MSKKREEVSSCVQCQGDKMLEVRRHADEAMQIMDMLSLEYGGIGGTTIVEFVQVLIEAEKDQVRLVNKIRNDAQRRIKEVESLIEALKFVSDTTKPTYSSGVSVSGKELTIQLSEVFRVAIHRLKLLTTGDVGLINGNQPMNERNFIGDLIAKKIKEGKHK